MRYTTPAHSHTDLLALVHQLNAHGSSAEVQARERGQAMGVSGPEGDLGYAGQRGGLNASAATFQGCFTWSGVHQVLVEEVERFTQRSAE